MSVLDTLPSPLDAMRDVRQKLTTDAYKAGKEFLGSAPAPSSIPLRIGSTLLGILFFTLGASTLVILASWLLGLYTMFYSIVWTFVKVTGRLKGLL